MQDNRETAIPINSNILSETAIYNIKKAYSILRSINHPLRQKMLEIIRERNVISVTELYIILRIEQSVTSQHLKILRMSGVVSTLREGKKIYYSVNVTRMEEIARFTENLLKVK